MTTRTGDAGAADWTIRKPAEADIPALTALGRRSFTETFGHLYRPEDLEAFLTETFGPGGLPDEVRDPAFRLRVAEAGGTLAGYAKIGPSSLPVPDDGRSKIELRQLYVLRDWQGSGMARALMEWALAAARAGEYDDMYLSVFSENIRAQRFYARYGFEEVGKVVFMVGDQADDDRLWRLKLR